MVEDPKVGGLTFQGLHRIWAPSAWRRRPPQRAPHCSSSTHGEKSSMEAAGGRGDPGASSMDQVRLRRCRPMDPLEHCHDPPAPPPPASAPWPPRRIRDSVETEKGRDEERNGGENEEEREYRQ
uniref:Uncharacterized protein n=1 Tax=Setaria italica TaxID=4555 RepID=K3YAU9_SETIT